MEWLLIVLAGIIQGITEFMPVSSSGHLLVLGNFFDLLNNFELYVLINIGTLGALVWYSRRTLGRLVQSVADGQYQLLAKLFVGILPAGVLGWFLADFFRFLGNNLYLLVAMLISIGVLMLFRQPRPKIVTDDLADIPWPKVLIIGSAQALALIPGTSRAGVTILTGLWTGLKQELAVSWSFLLAIPVIAGAVIRVLLSFEGAEFVSKQFGLVIAINIVSFLVGIFAISFLIKILQNHSLRPFGIYRIFFGLILLALLLTDVL